MAKQHQFGERRSYAQDWPEPLSLTRPSSLHWRLRRPDHHGPGREGPPSSLAGKTRRGSPNRPLWRPHRPAGLGDRRPQPPLVRTKLRPPDLRHPASCHPPDHPLDGRHAGRLGQGNRRRLRGQVHAAVVVLGRGRGREAHGPAPAQHAGRWRQEIRAVHHQWRRQVGGVNDRSRPDLPDHPDRSREGLLAGGQNRRNACACSIANRQNPGSKPSGWST